MIGRFFGVEEAGSTVPREVRAGFTTFLTMSYILFVNPQILSTVIRVPNAFAQILFATALASAVGSIVMGVVAKYPFALAPGMGLNAYFAFSVCMTMKIPWQTALGAVFVEALIFMVLSVGGIRQAVVSGIPNCIKLATTAGIGMFLALIGLKSAGIVASNPETYVTLGHLNAPGAWLALLGVLVTSVLMVRRTPGAVLIGILTTTLLAIVGHLPVYEGGKPFGGLPGGSPIAAPVWPHDLFAAMDLKAAFGMGVVGIVFTFLFVEIFDTAGTLIGLASKAGFLDENGNLPRANQAFFADAVATALGALFGTSTTTAFIESAAGIEEGGRTGLTAVVTGLLFAAALFAWPLASAVPGAATAPALFLVGAMMTVHLADVEWTNYAEAIPAFGTMVAMPFTYSIANGIGLGIVSYTLIRVFSGRFRELHPVTVVLAVLLIARYIWLSD
ncbi:MAG: NCS2 family permease [Candidatus Xenobia bacterium]